MFHIHVWRDDVCVERDGGGEGERGGEGEEV